MSDIHESSIDVGEVENKPVKIPGKPGRPRNPVDPNKVIPTEKRGRGRPRKPIDPNAVIEPPRKRGRPRKGEEKNKNKKYKPYLPEHKRWAEIYAITGKAAEATRMVYPEIVDNDKIHRKGNKLKKANYIRQYLEETAEKCATIQMGMIESDKTPAAVRNDAIKYRLDAIGVREQEEEKKGFSIEKLVIQIDKE